MNIQPYQLLSHQKLAKLVRFEKVITVYFCTELLVEFQVTCYNYPGLFLSVKLQDEMPFEFRINSLLYHVTSPIMENLKISPNCLKLYYKSSLMIKLKDSCKQYFLYGEPISKLETVKSMLQRLIMRGKRDPTHTCESYKKLHEKLGDMVNILQLWII